jgi:type I restriction enzyme M protein
MQLHEQLKGHIWDIANRLRGPYRPPQYRLVMLPIVVLRRLDCVLAPTKDRVLREYARLQGMGMGERAMDRMLGKAADPKRKYPLYNTSAFTFQKLLDDSENIAPNLVAYINGFSPTARTIFERFKFDAQIEKLDASNRLYTIVKEMAAVNLHPDTIDTLGDGKTRDGFEGKRFHFMLANPPFGVEWKDQKTQVENEHKQQGFSGRFGAGLPAINDGSLLFLQHMISKMHPAPDPAGDGGDEGSKIAIVFNGSPLFSGDAGSGPSNIRRWIIENDWLDAIVALPDQLFYNTGIYTYVWLVTNRKAPERRGKVQLIDGTRFFRKMKKSLNNKRNEITEDQIRHLTRVYGNFQDGETAEVQIDGEAETRVISRIFDNHEFGFLKVTVERPLRLNFEASPNRIARLDDQTAFANLAVSKKRKDKALAEREEAEGRKQQDAIRTLLATLEGKGRCMDRAKFDADLTNAAKQADVKLPAPIKKAIFAALGERDREAEICRDSKGRPEPDSELRDTENIPLPPGTTLPLPMDFGPDKPNAELIKAFKDTIDAYMQREVLPHVPDAWVDYEKTKVGYEIPISRHFYVYKPPRPLAEIEADITQLEGEIAGLLKGLMTP